MPHLRIGTTPRRVDVSIGLPAIVHTHGANGSGRRTFLLSLAEDLIQQGAGLVYVDAFGDPITWNALRGMTRAAKRTDSPIAVVAATSGRTPVLSSIATRAELDAVSAVETRSIVWLALDVEGPHASGGRDAAEGFVGLLADAVSSVGTSDGEPFAIILDGVQTMLAGRATAMHRLIDAVYAHGVTLVVSDPYTHWLDARLANASTGCVLSRLPADDHSRLSALYPLRASADELASLGEGESVTRAVIGAESVERHVRLRYPDVDYCRLEGFV